jgi:cytochrome P450/NADPH-cytochrome P450 reductase
VLTRRKSIFNLLDEHPACELPFHTYLEMLSLLSPRYYSISSSPRAASPTHCSITVGVVAGARELGQGVYKGVCSNFLAGRHSGDTIHAIVRETRAGFRLPDDPTTPIVMIGPGTGLAPFRGFLQERASLAADGHTLGPAKLFFGCRRSDQDFLYADELKDYEARGLVALHVAFSRADGAKTYVQHLLQEQRDSVWRMIEDGAIVYVCGDGGKMEPGVKATLMGIYREKSGASEDAAQKWIDNMGMQNRYVLDVWAGG